MVSAGRCDGDEDMRQIHSYGAVKGHGLVSCISKKKKFRPGERIIPEMMRDLLSFIGVKNNCLFHFKDSTIQFHILCTSIKSAQS